MLSLLGCGAGRGKVPREILSPEPGKIIVLLLGGQGIRAFLRVLPKGKLRNPPFQE